MRRVLKTSRHLLKGIDKACVDVGIITDGPWTTIDISPVILREITKFSCGISITYYPMGTGEKVQKTERKGRKGSPICVSGQK